MSLMSINIFIWAVVFDWCACARLDSLKLELTPVPTVQTCHQGSEKCGVVLAVHRLPNTVECLVDLWCFISSGWTEYAGSHMFSQQLQDESDFLNTTYWLCCQARLIAAGTISLRYDMIQRRFIIRDIVPNVVDKEISLRWDEESEEPSWKNVLKYLRICIFCPIETQCRVHYWCSASLAAIKEMLGQARVCK